MFTRLLTWWFIMPKTETFDYFQTALHVGSITKLPKNIVSIIRLYFGPEIYEEIYKFLNRPLQFSSNGSQKTNLKEVYSVSNNGVTIKEKLQLPDVLRYIFYNPQKALPLFLADRDREYRQLADFFLKEILKPNQTQFLQSLTERKYRASIHGSDELFDLFYIAAFEGFNNIIQACLLENKSIDDPCEHGRNTALHYAVIGGRKDTVDLLVSKGANVGLPNANGETPLTLALNTRRLNCLDSMLKEILRSKQTQFLKNLNLTEKKYRDIIRISNESFDLFYIAAYLGYNNIIQACLLENKSIDDPCEHERNTALHYAVIGGNKHTVDLLLSKGANAALSNTDGETPLSLAIKYKNKIIEADLIFHMRNNNFEIIIHQIFSEAWSYLLLDCLRINQGYERGPITIPVESVIFVFCIFFISSVMMFKTITSAPLDKTNIYMLRCCLVLNLLTYVDAKDPKEPTPNLLGMLIFALLFMGHLELIAKTSKTPYTLPSEKPIFSLWTKDSREKISTQQPIPHRYGHKTVRFAQKSD